MTSTVDTLARRRTCSSPATARTAGQFRLRSGWSATATRSRSGPCTDSGKVKRIRRDGTVLVGPCDMRGRLTGQEVPGQATILTPIESARVKQLLKQKYGLTGRITLWGSKIRRGEDGTLGIRIALS